MSAVLPSRTEARMAVAVRAPGRLHLGFLDPSGSLGRRFGSLGLVIEGFETHIELAPAAQDRLQADGAAAEAELGRAATLLARLRERTGLAQPVTLRLRQVLPAHAGFGSGTQLALALGRAFARCHGLAVSTAALAGWLGRGERSGIGIAGFDQGGLLLDGGPGAQGQPAPVIARLAWPAEWRALVVTDDRQQGLAGGDERQAIRTLAPLPQAAAAEICHHVLMRVLPGAAERDFAAFAGGVARIQEVVGGHFAPAQGGDAFTSAAVGRALRALRDAAGQEIGIGQSSWGPTGFAFAPSQAAAQQFVAAATRAGAIDPALGLRIVGGRNSGAVVSERPA